jgi:hypothetical protein
MLDFVANANKWANINGMKTVITDIKESSFANSIVSDYLQDIARQKHALLPLK